MYDWTGLDPGQEKKTAIKTSMSNWSNWNVAWTLDDIMDSLLMFFGQKTEEWLFSFLETHAQVFRSEGS